MRKSRLRNQFIFRTRYLVAEAGGEEGGGAGGGTEDPPAFDPKAFAETIQTTVTNLQNELKGTKKYGGEIASLKKMMGDLTEAVKGLKPVEQDAEDATQDEVTEETTTKRSVGRPKTTQTKTEDKPDTTAADTAITALQKQIKALEGQLKQTKDETAVERSARIAAETKQRNLERDRGILDAANTIGLADDVAPRDVLRQFKDDMEFDVEADAWVYVNGEERLPVDEAVKKFLPKYMQKPKVTRGGSGGSSPGSNNGPSKQQLKQNAIEAGARAAKDNRLISRYTQAKKVFEEAGGDVTEIIESVRSGV